MIIGISGYARSGKDTIANILAEQHGFVVMHFADKLRDALYALNPLIGYYNFDQYDPIYVQDAIDEYGWDGYKDTWLGPEIRRLLQRLGTEAGRQTLGENVWVNAIRDEISKTPVKQRPNIVIPDARFPNEARMIEDVYDGVMWRVERPGTKPINAHASENSLDDWDFEQFIVNDGTIEQLGNQVTRLWNNVYNEDFNPVIGKV